MHSDDSIMDVLVCWKLTAQHKIAARNPYKHSPKKWVFVITTTIADNVIRLAILFRNANTCADALTPS